MTTRRLASAGRVLPAALLALTLAFAPRGAAGAGAPADTAARLLQVRIDAPSVRKERLGQMTEMPIAVYLPPGYHTLSRRYPVVYFLPGFGDRVRDFVENRYAFALPDSVDRAIASGSTRELILVVVNGFNELGGSFYANSPVTGDWETWVASDVVRWVDAHFRTLSTPASRGLAGHSMGGSGALRIGMHRPDVFGAVYAMSPGLFAPGGLAQSVLLADSVATGVLREDSTLATLPNDQRMERLVPDLLAQDWTLFFAYAYGAAFAPDTTLPPPCVRYPIAFRNGRRVIDREVLRRWEAGFGDLEPLVRRHAAALRGMRGVGIEYGVQDELPWLPPGCRHLSGLLDRAHVRHELVQFQGAHDDHLGERLRTAMLPFFSRTLAFD